MGKWNAQLNYSFILTTLTDMLKISKKSKVVTKVHMADCYESGGIFH
jgi:hypothetical protein